MSEGAYPAPRTAWTMVALLTVAYILSFVDRSILGLLIEPIKADLNLSDAQISLVMGPAFGLLYALSGLPLGYFADRKRRTWLVSAGIALWSLATALSGLARDFWHLFAARMGVGVGEAVLSPCAMSMIGDSYLPNVAASQLRSITLRSRSDRVSRRWSGRVCSFGPRRQRA